MRQTDKWTDRQAGRQAGRQIGRHTDSQSDRYIQIASQTGRQTVRQTDRLTDRHAGRQIGRQSDRQAAGRQTDNQTNKQTDRQTYAQTSTKAPSRTALTREPSRTQAGVGEGHFLARGTVHAGVESGACVDLKMSDHVTMLRAMPQTVVGPTPPSLTDVLTHAHTDSVNDWYNFH